MTVYIALLRGINVGGKHKIKMADLMAQLTELGLAQIQTYIQSGNVLFRSDEQEDSLRQRMEQRLMETYGFQVPVMLRTIEEWEQLVAACPFTVDEIEAAESCGTGESLYVAYMHDEPDAAKIKAIQPYENERERCAIMGREVFLLFHGSIRDSKLASHLNKLGESTVRNWKTTIKLIDLAKSYSRE